MEGAGFETYRLLQPATRGCCHALLLSVHSDVSSSVRLYLMLTSACWHAHSDNANMIMFSRYDVCHICMNFGLKPDRQKSRPDDFDLVLDRITSDYSSSWCGTWTSHGKASESSWDISLASWCCTILPHMVWGGMITYMWISCFISHDIAQTWSKLQYLWGKCFIKVYHPTV